MNKVFKKYLVIGIVSGVLMGLFMGWLGESATEGLIWGIGSGVLLALTGLVEWKVHKEFAGKYACETGETLLREGWAVNLEQKPNPFSGGRIVGYVRLTNRRVHFQSGKRHDKAQDVSVPLADIVETKPYRLGGWAPTGLHIRTAKADEYFTVDFGANKEWVEAVMRAKAAHQVI